MVEITSAEEEALLDSLYGFGHIYWIGLTDIAVEGWYDPIRPDPTPAPL